MGGGGVSRVVRHAVLFPAGSFDACFLKRVVSDPIRSDPIRPYPDEDEHG